ncbi:MAG: hypothetical protein WC325_13350 [Candidatus Bathyarchaeia archaeon]|jgi:hypothetical protein
MESLKDQIPICQKCKEPMTYTNTIYAVKGKEKLKIRVFTCPTDKTFTHTKN